MEEGDSPTMDAAETHMDLPDDRSENTKEREAAWCEEMMKQ